MDRIVIKTISDFWNNYPAHIYKKGDFLKLSEKTPKGVSFLKNGVVRSVSFSKEGQELTINIFKPISFFPVGWAINNSVDKFAYEALTDLEVIMVPRDDFKKFLLANPNVTYNLLKRIYRGLEGYFLRMESLLFGSPYFRTVVQLVIHSRRFDLKKGKKYNVNLTHAKLASLAGLSRETITREIKKLEKEKIVSYEGKKLVVLDQNRLEAELVV